MSSELHKGMLDPAAAPVAPVRLSWREKRWQRRRRRRMAEEVLGWILVPVIVVSAYGFLKLILGALGTTPTAVLDGLQVLLAGLERL
jgi:hypothetical protein